MPSLRHKVQLAAAAVHAYGSRRKMCMPTAVMCIRRPPDDSLTTENTPAPDFRQSATLPYSVNDKGAYEK